MDFCKTTLCTLSVKQKSKPRISPKPFRLERFASKSFRPGNWSRMLPQDGVACTKYRLWVFSSSIGHSRLSVGHTRQLSWTHKSKCWSHMVQCQTHTMQCWTHRDVLSCVKSGRHYAKLVEGVQGYLAHKKEPPPFRAATGPWAYF